MSLLHRFSILMKRISGASQKHFFYSIYLVITESWQGKTLWWISLVVMSTSSISVALPAFSWVVVLGSNIVRSPNRGT